MVENPPALEETHVCSLGQEDPLEEETATHSSILAWRIPWKEEPGGLQSMGSQSVDSAEPLTRSLPHCLLAGCRDPRWMLGPKIFSVYPPPLSSKPGNSFLDCSAGLHGIHVGVLLCRYLEFSFLPSDKVRHHTCPCFSSSQNTLALPAL